jgi:hypothetical protein
MQIVPPLTPWRLAILSALEPFSALTTQQINSKFFVLSTALYFDNRSAWLIFGGCIFRERINWGSLRRIAFLPWRIYRSIAAVLACGFLPRRSIFCQGRLIA